MVRKIKNQGNTPPERPGPVRPGDSQIAGNREVECGRGAGGVCHGDRLSEHGGETGRRGVRDAVSRQERTGKRVRTVRLDQGSPRARPCRRDAVHPARRVHRREDSTPGQTGRTALPAGRPTHHRPCRGTRARPRRDCRTGHRRLRRPASEHRFPGSHRIGHLHIRVGEIRMQGDAAAPATRACRTSPNRWRQSRSNPEVQPSSCASTPRMLLLTIDEWLVYKPDDRFGGAPARAHGTALRQRWHRVREPVGNQGIAQSSRLRHHRRCHPRPYRAQHGMDQYRQVRHETGTGT